MKFNCIKDKVERRSSVCDLRNPACSGFGDMGKWVVIQEGIMRDV